MTDTPNREALSRAMDEARSSLRAMKERGAEQLDDLETRFAELEQRVNRAVERSHERAEGTSSSTSGDPEVLQREASALLERIQAADASTPAGGAPRSRELDPNAGQR